MTKLYPIIVFEGLDFAGKTTVLNRLKAEYPDIAYLHEPGGTEISEEIATILAKYGKRMQKHTKTLLFQAARSELVQKLRTLQTQRPIIIDRFVGSTLAYQGYGDGQDLNRLLSFNDYVLSDLTIDTTVLFNISIKTMLERRATRLEKIDELDQYDSNYYQTISDNYYNAISDTPTKYIVEIDANQDIDTVYEQVVEMLKKYEVL